MEWKGKLTKLSVLGSTVLTWGLQRASLYDHNAEKLSSDDMSGAMS